MNAARDNQNLIDILERVMNDVLVGAVTTIGIVCVHVEYGDEKHIATQWAHDSRGDLLRLLGGLEVLKARVALQFEMAGEHIKPDTQTGILNEQEPSDE